MKNNTNWNELAAIHHAAMVANGNHINYSHTKLLMWGIEEVGEANAAWRKNRRADMAAFNAFSNKPDNDFLMYVSFIKGTIEEELADIACIMMDFAATSGGEIEVALIEPNEDILQMLIKIASLICKINDLSDAPDYVDTKTIASHNNDIFGNLETIAFVLCIDLEEQVRLKMQYNATRPFRHGDKN